MTSSRTGGGKSRHRPSCLSGSERALCARARNRRRSKCAGRFACPRGGMAMESDDCDVVVVGGGPAGAAAAARLAARGFGTVLVDRASFPRDKVCGDFVGPMALAELADLGVAQLEAFGATSAMATLALHVDDGRPALLDIPQVDGIPGYGRVIPRLQLDAWIVDAARQAGATVLD